MTVVIRVISAAAVGAALVLLWWGVFRLAPDLPSILVSRGECTPGAEPLCDFGAELASIVAAVALVAGLSVPLGWFGLWLARVRPAWPVGLLGPVLVFLINWLADPVADAVAGSGTLARTVLPVAVGYALAALITTRRRVRLPEPGRNG